MTAWDVPLGDSEVAGLAKSVERYRRSWIAKGRFLHRGPSAKRGQALWACKAPLCAVRPRAGRNKSIREDPRINAELASEHGLTVRRIQQIRNRN